MRSLLDTGEMNRRAIADKGIQKQWWNSAWIPFADNGGGDYLCLDLAPMACGNPGQVIAMRHDSPDGCFCHRASRLAR